MVHVAWPMLLAIVAIALLVASSHTALAQDGWSFDAPVLVAEDLRHPVDLEFGPDGHLYFASLTNREIHRMDTATGQVDDDFLITLDNATWKPGTETGLFSLAFHPDAATNDQLYVSYSSNSTGPWLNVLSRLTLENETGGHSEEVLLTRPGNIFHNGGRLLIADGHLYWTTGDASNPFQEPPEVAGQVAQEDGDLRGKVLRLTLDGAPAPGNAWNDEVYTKGHRNVYGIAWDPSNERLAVTENGNARADYVYILESGGNFGWPHCEGTCEEPDPRYIDPVWESDSTVAPTGITWFRDAFWFGTYNQGELMRMSDVDGDWDVQRVHAVPGTDKVPPRIVDVEVGPDNESLWVSSWTQVWRLDFGAWSSGVLGNGTLPTDDVPDSAAQAPAAGGAVSMLTLVALAGIAAARRRDAS